MARVAVLIRLLPEEAEIKADTLIEKVRQVLPSQYQIARYQAEPIAFGLEALRMIVLMPEETAGGTNELEEILASIEGVSQVDVLNVSRLIE